MIFTSIPHIYKVYTDGVCVRKFSKIQEAYRYCRSVFGSHEIWLVYDPVYIDKYSSCMNKCLDKINTVNPNVQLKLF